VIAVPLERGGHLSSPVWIGSHHLLEGVRLSPDGAAAVGGDGSTLWPEDQPLHPRRASLQPFYVGIMQHSRAQGEKTFDYLTEERTRLFPRAAFEAGGEDLLALVRGQRGPATEYERILAEDVEAVVFLHVPQVPSSRALGTFPIGSFDEYRRRVPSDTSRWKIVNVSRGRFPRRCGRGGRRTRGARRPCRWRLWPGSPRRAARGVSCASCGRGGGGDESRAVAAIRGDTIQCEVLRVAERSSM